MANHLKMAKAQAIQTLREQGWSLRRIARTLRISRVTVKRHVELGRARAAPPTGSDVQTGPNPPTGSAAKLDPTRRPGHRTSAGSVHFGAVGSAVGGPEVVAGRQAGPAHPQAPIEANGSTLCRRQVAEEVVSNPV